VVGKKVGLGVIGIRVGGTVGELVGLGVMGGAVGIGVGGTIGGLVGVTGGEVGLGEMVGVGGVKVFSLHTHGISALANPLALSQTTHPRSKLTRQQASGPMVDPQ
jgi:hypothetical protein